MKSAAVAIPVYLPQVLIHGTCQSYKLLVNKCLQTEHGWCCWQTVLCNISINLVPISTVTVIKESTSWHSRQTHRCSIIRCRRWSHQLHTGCKNPFLLEAHSSNLDHAASHVHYLVLADIHRWSSKGLMRPPWVASHGILGMLLGPHILETPWDG